MATEGPAKDRQGREGCGGNVKGARIYRAPVLSRE
jgi:hypothetical protein